MVRQINGLAKLFTVIGWFNHPMCMHTCKGWITDWFYTLRTCTGWRCFVLLHFNTMNCFHTSMPCPPPPTYRPDWKILLCLRKGSGGSSWSTWSFFFTFFLRIFMSKNVSDLDFCWTPRTSCLQVCEFYALCVEIDLLSVKVLCSKQALQLSNTQA